MNNGAFGEGFPYSNFHNLNMDWIIKIAKDFLDQYTHIQEIIENGEASLQELTESGLEELQTKTTELETLLQEWYDTHSADIANQLADALVDLNEWYNTHQNYLDQTLTDNISTFTTRANQIAAQTIESIPEDYTDFYNDFQAIQKNLRTHNIIQPKNAWGYFYSYGYYNSNLVFDDTNRDIITLKIPLPNPSFVILKSLVNFQLNLSTNVLFTWEHSDGTIDRQYISGDTRTVATKSDNLFEAGCASWGDVTAVYIAVIASCMDGISVFTNDPISCNLYSAEMPKGITVLDHNNTAYGTIFRNETQYSQLSSDGIAYWMEVKQGDVFSNLSLVTGINYLGSFRSKDGTIKTRIPNAQTYTVPADGIINLFDFYSTPKHFVYTPIHRIKLMASDILDLGSIPVNEYNGLNAVAFGTSLTYRALTGEGYLDYLPLLSGMNIDNQGAGGGVIHAHGDQPDILSIIRNYANFADKRVCLLEGFCNDFGYNYDLLGTYTDSNTNTVCGAVRVALNYIMSRNPNITIFLILDHYGRNYNGTDNSSTAVNRNNQTQYVWYEEIAKVAESLGIPVIKLYAISGISENTPQYLMDNIHPTALGARQTAKVIWEQMKLYYPNTVE